MESKFINKQTLDYLKSIEGDTVTDQIQGVNQSLVEVIEYLGDFEKYVDAVSAETEKRLKSLETDVKNAKSLITFITKVQNEMDKRHSRNLRIVITAALALSATLIAMVIYG